MRNIFKASTDGGEDWFMCFGQDYEGKTWYVSTDRIPGSQAAQYLIGPKEDAELAARLLNEHYCPPGEEDTIMVNVNHPCYEIDICPLETGWGSGEDAVYRAEGQGYITLKELRELVSEHFRKKMENQKSPS